MAFDFELKFDVKDMRKFLLRYNYTKSTGIFYVLLGIAAAVLCVGRWEQWNANQKIAWIVIAVLLLVVQPLALIYKAGKQMKQEKMQTPTKIHIDKEGITATKEESAHCDWKNVRKIVCYRDAIYIFTTAVSATIITRKSCEETFDELTEFVKGTKRV